MDDLISRQAAIDEIKEIYEWHDNVTKERIIEHFKQLPPANNSEIPNSSDTISRQAAIDEIEYELEMINSALDSITLDFNARERLRQRRGEAREILNSIQQLPSAQPTEASCWGCNCQKMERLKEQKTFSEMVHLHDAERREE